MSYNESSFTAENNARSRGAPFCAGRGRQVQGAFPPRGVVRPAVNSRADKDLRQPPYPYVVFENSHRPRGTGSTGRHHSHQGSKPVYYHPRDEKAIPVTVQNLNFIQVNTLPQGSDKTVRADSQRAVSDAVYKLNNVAFGKKTKQVSGKPETEQNRKRSAPVYHEPPVKKKRNDLANAQASLRNHNPYKRRNQPESSEVDFESRFPSFFNLIMNAADLKTKSFNFKQALGFIKHFISILASLQLNRDRRQKDYLLKSHSTGIQYVVSILLQFLRPGVDISTTRRLKISDSHETLAECLFVFVLLLERLVIMAIMKQEDIDSTNLETILREFNGIKLIFYEPHLSQKEGLVNTFKSIYSRIWSVLTLMLGTENRDVQTVDACSRKSFRLLVQHFGTIVFKKLPLKRKINIPSNSLLSMIKNHGDNEGRPRFKDEVLKANSDTVVRLLLSLGLPIAKELQVGRKPDMPVIIADESASFKSREKNKVQLPTKQPLPSSTNRMKQKSTMKYEIEAKNILNFIVSALEIADKVKQNRKAERHEKVQSRSLPPEQQLKPPQVTSKKDSYCEQLFAEIRKLDEETNSLMDTMKKLR